MDELVETNTSGLNTIHMVNSTIMAKLRYTFAAVEWRMQDLEWVNKMVRKKLYEAKVSARRC